MLTTGALQGVLGQSFYAGPPNAGTYATPTIVSGDPTPAFTDAFQGASSLGGGIGKLSLGMLGVIVLTLAALNYWLRPVSA